MPKRVIQSILVYCANLAGRILEPKRRIRQIKWLLQPTAGQTRIQKVRQAIANRKHKKAREAATTIVNHAINPVLSYPVFGTLVHNLVKSDASNHILFNALFSISGKVNWHERPDKYASFRSQLKQVCNKMPQDDDNVFWFGLALGFVDEELTAAQVESLLLLEIGKLGWLFCDHPFHAKTIASFRAYARAAVDDPAVANTLPEASRKKLGIVLACIDYGLLDKLRHVLLPMTKQAPTRADAVRPNRKLRIAVCISGQLRGYRRAFASWHNLGLESHDADYFVHVWQRIGRKIPRVPIRIQLQRLFADAFCDVYADALRQHGAQNVERTYPGFFHFFTAGGDCVTQAELQRFYRTDAVVAEDDAAAPFCEFNNPKKMYYKTEQAYRLAMASGKDYDLIVRIRPDKEILPPYATIDWGKVYEDCERDAIIFADGPLYLVGNLSLPDQIACGAAHGMAAYSTAFSKTNSEQGLIAEYVNQRFQPHRNFAYALLEDGFGARALSKAGVRLGGLQDPARLSASEVKALLQQDIGKRNRHELDAVFLAALEKDLAAER